MKETKNVIELNLNEILPNRFQPRIKFEDESINELSASIKEHGVIQPIIVRKISDKYEIIAGERRYKASVLAGLTTIPAIITEFNDKDSAEIALIENVQRQDLSPIEKAVSYRRILDMGDLTQENLAIKVGKSQSSIANTLRLLTLPEIVQDAVLDQNISERHARSLLKLKNTNKQIELLNKTISERLTVRQLDELIDAQDDNSEKLPSLEALFTEESLEIKNNKAIHEIDIEELDIPSSPIIGDEVTVPIVPVIPIEDLKKPVEEVISNMPVPPEEIEQVVDPIAVSFLPPRDEDLRPEVVVEQAEMEIQKEPEKEQPPQSGKFFTFAPEQEIELPKEPEETVKFSTGYDVLSEFNPKEMKEIPENNYYSSVETTPIPVNDDHNRPTSVRAIKRIRDITKDFNLEGLNIEIEELDLGTEYKINITIKDE